MNQNIIKGRQPNADERFIREKHLESLTRQPMLMNELAKQLLTLELAIPGLFATVLKLLSGGNGGDAGKLTLTSDLYSVFLFWLFSLAFSILALLPRAYKVDANDLTAIRQSFYKAASYKYFLILASIICFVIGILFAIKDLAS